MGLSLPIGTVDKRLVTDRWIGKPPLPGPKQLFLPFPNLLEQARERLLNRRLRLKRHSTSFCKQENMRRSFHLQDVFKYAEKSIVTHKSIWPEAWFQSSRSIRKTAPNSDQHTDARLFPLSKMISELQRACDILFLLLSCRCR